jgi:hypothetical protein
MPDRTQWEQSEGVQPNYSMTNFGLQIWLPVAKMPKQFEGYIFAFLACTYGPEKESTLIFLHQRDRRPKGHFYRTTFSGHAVLHRALPKAGYGSEVAAQPLWISGHEFQSRGEIAQSTQGPPRLPETIFRCDHWYFGMLEYFPRLGWLKGSEEESIVIEDGMHITIILRFDLSRQQTRQDMLFVFGRHNSQPWFDFTPYDASRTIEEYHVDYDLFALGPFWRGRALNSNFLHDPGRFRWVLDAPQLSSRARGVTLDRQIRYFPEHGDTVELFILR